MPLATLNPVVKKAIRDALVAHARSGTFPFYGELGQPLGLPPRWKLWKEYLDSISDDEKKQRLPDVTWIVRSTAARGLPGQMDKKRVVRPTPADWDRAADMAQHVIDHYCPTAKNVFRR
jgi:hypothetical protein